MTLYGAPLDALPAIDAHSDGWRVDLIGALRESLRENLLKSCYRAARCLREFRKTFGMKMATPLMLYQASQLVSALIKVSTANPPPGATVRRNKHAIFTVIEELASEGTHELDDRSFALEEGFRFLLGSAPRMVLSRGMARMAYCTAKALEVQLPKVIHEMVKTMADTAWRNGDSKMFSSAFPSPYVSGGKIEERDWSLETCLRRWEDIQAV